MECASLKDVRFVYTTQKTKKVAGERGDTGLAVEVTVAGLIRRMEFVYSSGGQNQCNFSSKIEPYGKMRK